jgi:hypothetical protein
MKKESRKLDLKRETLITMQDTELDAVQGGNIIAQSSDFCAQVASAVINGSFAVTTELMKTRRNCDPKPGGPAPEKTKG